MRFTAATVAFGLSAVAVAQGDVNTIYSTEDVTITSCGPTVTDCPSRQTPTSTPQGVEAETSSVPAVATSSAVASSTPVAPAPVETPSQQAPAPQPPSPSVVPVEVPTSSASVIPITTCIPTTTYSTVMVPGASQSSSTIQVGGVPPRPSGAAARGTSSVPVIPGPSGQAAVPSGSAR